MKRILAIALSTLATLGASTGALAQDRALVANVPFNFTVGETSMPAGEYIISAPDNGVVRFQSRDKQVTATVAALPGHQDSSGGPKLVFDRYGNQYFLHRVLCARNSRMNIDVPAWKQEKRARSREAKLETGEKVLVAAR